MLKRMILTCVILSFIQLQAFSQKYKETLLTSKDGVGIKGTLYHMKEDCDCKGPVAILLHMLGGTRADWADFAKMLQEQGFDCLAIDFRGHGASTEKGARTLDYKKFSEKDWNDAVNDVAAAVQFVMKSKSDRPCVIIGASIGANLAIKYAATDKNITAVALLSPSTEYRGVKIEVDIVSFGKRPLFIAVSQEDGQSYGKLATLKTCAQKGGAALKILEYNQVGHGTEMLKSSPKLAKDLAGWFGETFVTK